jgi:hypothetical protein
LAGCGRGIKRSHTEAHRQTRTGWSVQQGKWDFGKLGCKWVSPQYFVNGKVTAGQAPGAWTERTSPRRIRVGEDHYTRCPGLKLSRVAVISRTSLSEKVQHPRNLHRSALWDVCKRYHQASSKTSDTGRTNAGIHSAKTRGTEGTRGRRHWTGANAIRRIGGGKRGAARPFEARFCTVNCARNVLRQVRGIVGVSVIRVVRAARGSIGQRERNVFRSPTGGEALV